MSRTKLNIFGHYKNAQEHCAEGAKILKFSLLKTKKLVIPGINDSEMMVKVQRFLDLDYMLGTSKQLLSTQMIRAVQIKNYAPSNIRYVSIIQCTSNYNSRYRA